MPIAAWMAWISLYQDWPIDLLNYTRAWHKPKYHGTEFRGMKRWK